MAGMIDHRHDATLGDILQLTRAFAARAAIQPDNDIQKHSWRPLSVTNVA
jgi:hypothetical protein